MNNQEYYAEVNAIAESLVEVAMEENNNDVEQAMEEINDILLHEVIDGHKWIIYYSYNSSIINHSDNDEYMIDNIGLDSAAEALKGGGLSGLHQAIAFWAFYADVYELLQDKMDEFLDNLNIEE